MQVTKKMEQQYLKAAAMDESGMAARFRFVRDQYARQSWTVASETAKAMRKATGKNVSGLTGSDVSKVRNVVRYLTLAGGVTPDRLASIIMQGSSTSNSDAWRRAYEALNLLKQQGKISDYTKVDVDRELPESEVQHALELIGDARVSNEDLKKANAKSNGAKDPEPASDPGLSEIMSLIHKARKERDDDVIIETLLGLINHSI